jgi:hypothetical protein
MPQKIVRIYDSVAQGAKVATHLANEGYQHIYQFKGVSGKSAASVNERKNMIAQMMDAHIWQSHAEAYADRLAKSGALVIVHAPFGSAKNAMAVMDSYAPIDVGHAETHYTPDFVWDDRAPLSSVLQMPVLTNISLPFETLTGVSSLTKGLAFLSNLLGIPLLSAGSAKRNTSMGFPMLSASATPLSSSIGMRTLSQNATPLSSLFNLPVLTRKK